MPVIAKVIVRAQETMRKYGPKRESLSDDPTRERREEARRESDKQL
jgi:hypothetical protein